MQATLALGSPPSPFYPLQHLNKYLKNTSLTFLFGFCTPDTLILNWERPLVQDNLSACLHLEQKVLQAVPMDLHFLGKEGGRTEEEGTCFPSPCPTRDLQACVAPGRPSSNQMGCTAPMVHQPEVPKQAALSHLWTSLLTKAVVSWIKVRQWVGKSPGSPEGPCLLGTRWAEVCRAKPDAHSEGKGPGQDPTSLLGWADPATAQ